MIKKLQSYIFFTYFKYLFSFTILFIFIIWISQILRIIDLKFSVTNQLISVVSSTILVLPSFINVILPIILIITSFYLNFNFNTSNENQIIQQYLNRKNIRTLKTILTSFLMMFYIINGEWISPKLYKIYKEKEIEIRNSLKLGIPNNKEFHIGNKLSIFFDQNLDNSFSKVEAIIYDQSQFIKSDQATIEYDRFGFNIIFLSGYRIKMNDQEKSKTIFKKFTYNLENNDLEEVTFDKEHFNTIELLKSKNKSFSNYGHNKIYQYLLLIILLITSIRISLKKNINKNTNPSIAIFIVIIASYISNSFSLHMLNKDTINLNFFYIINLITLIIVYQLISKINDNK